ncbi:hypothetical protein [Mesorhizobium hawassense]|uniref:hypothetical protein n=1 Tax=Mesorhizobium hawassense TaxID=1209954 RepID=UPI001FE1342D|nr:hypothetical protein [Mesorhizobium hawassense]
MKCSIFLILSAAVVFGGLQFAPALAAPASKFRTCSGIDGTFQIPASQKCPLSGYARADQPTKMDTDGRPMPATPAPRSSKFRTCSGFDGTFHVPVSQKCPLSGYAHGDQPTQMDARRSANPASAPQSLRYRNCSGIDGTFQVPVSQKCPLSGYAHY